MFQDLAPVSTIFPSNLPSSLDLPAAEAAAFPTTMIGAAAGWHSGDDIDTLVGLQGTFQWLENPFQFARIRFTFNPGQSGSAGVYAITGLFGTLERGQFGCATHHPLLGNAVIGLAPNNDPARQILFVILGLYTDSDWKIYIMQLKRVLSDGSLGPLFSAYRTA